MSQVSFYPGPSRIYSHVTEHIYEAYMSGLLSSNHRSEPFMELVAETKAILREKLTIPTDYEIAFVSSATESWEIVAQSLCQDKMAIAYNGTFGEKWAGYAKSIVPDLSEIPFGLQEFLPVEKITASKADLIGLVHSETSNGTHVDQSLIKKVRDNNPNAIVAVDATSSMAGIKLDFNLADIWYASVQKCFGLPSGMGIMIIAPKAAAKAQKVGHSSTYNSLTKILENTQKNQTHYTPNTLGIYLLNKTQVISKGIDYSNEKLTIRFNNWVKILERLEGLDWLVKVPDLRSVSVLALECKKPAKLKKAALTKGIILGNGYGPWKESTVRIANFPAIKGKEVERLVKFLERYFD